MTAQIMWNGHTILCVNPCSNRLAKEPWHLVPFLGEISWKTTRGGAFVTLCRDYLVAARCWSDQATMGITLPPDSGVCIDCLWKFIKDYLE